MVDPKEQHLAALMAVPKASRLVAWTVCSMADHSDKRTAAKKAEWWAEHLAATKASTTAASSVAAKAVRSAARWVGL